jgi:hypothetical protein
MATAIRIWRVLLWIFGAVFALPFAVLFWRQIRDSEWEYYASSYALIVLCFVASVLGPVCAFGMKRATRWARPVGWITASLQTLAIPVFTPLGIFGLILLSRGAGKAGTLPSSAPPLRWREILAWTVIGLPVQYFAIDGSFRWAKRLGYPDAPGEAIALLMLWACILFEVAIHEVGHALAVKFVRGHIHWFQIGPLRWRRESGRTWMEFSRILGSAGSVAWSAGLPHQLARQWLLVAAGGPFANLVCGLIALAVFPKLGSLGVPSAWPWAMFLGVSSLASLANLWPRRNGYRNTDGAIIHGLLTSPEWRRLYEIGLFQGMSESSELRPREWPRADLEWMLALEPIPLFASRQFAILHAGCAHYLDCGDIAEAVHCARRFHNLAREQPKRCSPESFPEATFALAFYGDDPESARDLWARRPVGAPIQFELAERLASAAIATEDRPAAIRRAWECSELYGSCGILEYLREQLRRLEMGSLASSPIASNGPQSEPAGAIL